MSRQPPTAPPLGQQRGAQQEPRDKREADPLDIGLCSSLTDPLRGPPAQRPRSGESRGDHPQSHGRSREAVGRRHRCPRRPASSSVNAGARCRPAVARFEHTRAQGHPAGGERAWSLRRARNSGGTYTKMSRGRNERSSGERTRKIATMTVPESASQIPDPNRAAAWRALAGTSRVVSRRHPPQVDEPCGA